MVVKVANGQFPLMKDIGSAQPGTLSVKGSNKVIKELVRYYLRWPGIY